MLNQAAAVRGAKVDKITGRAIAGMGQQAVESASRLGEDFMLDPRSSNRAANLIPSVGKVTTVDKRISTPQEARVYVLEKFRDRQSFPDAEGDRYRRDYSYNTRTLAPEEAALIEEAKILLIRKLEIETQFKDLGRLVDPLGKDALSVIAATAGTSLAIMGITALTQGASTPILAGVYSSATYDELRQKYPDADPAELSKIADLTGVIQAPLDMLSLGLLKRLPGVKSLLTGSLQKALLKNPLVRAGGIYLGEQVTEGLQDITPDALILALKADIPGYDWDREKKEFWGSRWQVAVGTLPLTLLGLGAASGQEVKGARQTLADDNALGSLGLGDKDRATIANLARTGRMDEAMAALKDAMQRRDPAVAKQFHQQAEAVAAKQAKAFQDLMRDAGLTITREGDQYIVTNRAGAKAAFNSADEAVAAVQAHVGGGKSDERGNDAVERHQAPSLATPLPPQQEQSQADADGKKSPAIRFAELQQQFPNATPAQLQQLQQIAHDFDPRQGLSLHSFAQGQIGSPPKVSLTNWNSQSLSVDNNIQMPYLNETDESQNRDTGRNAQDALRELTKRAEDDAGGSTQADAGERIRAEAESLVSWGKERGWLIEPKRLESLTGSFEELEGGVEHHVTFDPQSGRVLKITQPPNFGARGNLVDYLHNITWSNMLFGDNIAFEGVIQTPSGPAIVVSQPFVRGRKPTMPEVIEWMEVQGYVPDGYNKWRHPDTGAVIADAHTGNFVLTETGVLLPIDLQILNPGKRVLDELK